ncbi:ABC transporter permease [Microbacteriaceae bacterium 4G12]
MWRDIWKEKRFVIGFSFVFFLLVASFVNTIWNGGKVHQVSLLFDSQRNVIGAPPFPPSWNFLLGTDRGGFDVLHMIIQGAKFTIGIALLIAALRIIISTLFGILLGLYGGKWTKSLERIFDSFNVVPLSLIAYFILANVLWMPFDGFPHPFWKRATFEVIILTILAVPTVMFFISKDIQKLWKEEFMEAAKVLGGSKLHILRIHILPHTMPRWLLLFMQQFIQVLLVLIQLGLLELFFGGTLVDYSKMNEAPKSLSYEWSGIIGQQYKVLFITPWVVGGPILFLTLTIYSVQLMMSGIENALKKGALKVQEDVEEKKVG